MVNNIPSSAHKFLAPAKLNLMLKIVGRREDGYHLLETIFRFVDLYDVLYLQQRSDEQIILHSDLDNINPEDNLVYQAAKKMQPKATLPSGVDIWLEKNIPIGGGLGGGSSDAATVLMALNDLWQCGLDKHSLMKIGLSLGADVPVFIFGENSFATGIGEKLKKISIPKQWYVIIKPEVSVATAQIFNHQDLTRDSKNSIIHTLENSFIHDNDMQAVVFKEYPQVKSAYLALSLYSKAMMSGSGSCVFSIHDQEQDAKNTFKKVKEKFSQVYCVAGLAKHPLNNF